jgi:pterin-4a-carbinolamine dehydratase
MSRGKLSKQEIAAGLHKLDGWSVVKGNLHRVFEFKASNRSGRSRSISGQLEPA